MTIGEQLKRERMLLGITQKQMCAGIITDATYSRVERNKNEINIIDLICILNKWQISFNDFFSPFDISPINQEIGYAFINRDIPKLEALSKDRRVQDESHQFEFRLIKAILNDKVEDLSFDLKQKARWQILPVGEFNTNFLFKLQLVMPFYSFEENKSLISYVLGSSKEIDVTDKSTSFFLSVLVAYTKQCIRRNQIDEARKIIDFIQNFPNGSSVYVYKALALYYLADIEKDEKRKAKTKDLIELVGYSKFID
ncbi:helix-turn-helix domain-containing protein [Lactobacillus amylovorus]|uniref:helix-turn-helix domain-containing protein n=1 Tax=Lactobacillus amylovorus TaxID=1604 RepID=UPI00232FE0B1|nr:helix-turn-helix transcriptional regulator [Lactobacillus amylovorus]MDB6224807.1 helix-turn-helix domain-containing protein [Lactobacillus amylovorus]